MRTGYCGAGTTWVAMVAAILVAVMFLTGRGEAQENPPGQQETTAEQSASLKTTDSHAALNLLKDWSIWLVGLQTGALALVSFIAGKDGFFKFTNGLARWLVYIAIVSFALSVVAATWVLGAIPSIRMRLENTGEANSLWGVFGSLGVCPSPPADTPTGNFYCMRALDDLEVPFVFFTSAEHWLFIIGILLFAFALAIEKVRDRPPQNPGTAS